MNISDLIEELRKFPELSTPFIQTNDGKIHRIDSVHQIWVQEVGGKLLIDITEQPSLNPAATVDYGALMYG